MRPAKIPETIVIAIGGNAITRETEDGNIHQQFLNIRRALVPVAGLIAQGKRIVLTHGNGPQVGNMLIRVEESRHLVPPIPLGVMVADLQGGMGYMIQQTLQNKLRKRNIDRDVVTIITQSIVDRNDPSILEPSKFVGPVFDEIEIKKFVQERGWQVKVDIGRGWRRVVPSPKPVDFVERRAIAKYIEDGTVVIAGGGGGIPVYLDEKQHLEGIDAVIDKDLAASVLAASVHAEVLCIVTSVEHVALKFSSAEQVNLSRITVEEAEQWLKQGEFPAGSMGPKIEAAIHFLKNGGKTCIITTIEKLDDALQGSAGTRITK